MGLLLFFGEVWLLCFRDIWGFFSKEIGVSSFGMFDVCLVLCFILYWGGGVIVFVFRSSSLVERNLRGRGRLNSVGRVS